MRVTACLFLFVFACAGNTQAPQWGKTGHQIIAAIATALLPSSVVANATSILGGQTMVSVAAWADEVRDQPGWRWSAPLHFINCPSWACVYKFSTDCPDSMCIDGAIHNFTKQMQRTGSNYDVALKFLIHFYGDIHQPLHVGFKADRGGNDIKGTFMGYADNLHAIWDDYIIDVRMERNFDKSQDKYAAYLVKQVKGAWASKADTWKRCKDGESWPCSDQWANESAGLSCTKAYTDSTGAHIKNGFVLGDPYYDFTYETVDEQLAKGGVRLAHGLMQLL